jgi:four helix bundle protein
LRDQILRAATSIPSNIAEGAARGSDKDFRRFLWHSLGSCNELEYDLLLARDLRLVPRDLHGTLVQQIEDVRRMLSGLVKVADTDRVPAMRRAPETRREAGSGKLKLRRFRP